MSTTRNTIPRIYIAVGVVVLLLIVLQFIKPNAMKRVFFVDYKTVFENTETVEIASFQPGESWKGNFTLDTGRSFTSETGLNFYSMNGAENEISFSKDFDLSTIDSINLFIFAPDETPNTQIDSFKIIFSSSTKDSFETSIIIKSSEWNYISIPTKSFKKIGNPKWGQVRSVKLRLTSNKKATVQLSLDRIWGEKQNKPNPLIDTPYGPFLNLKSVEENTFLHLGAHNPFSLFIRPRDEGNRFTYTISFVPLKHQSFCSTFNFSKLTGSGYLFCVEGGRMDAWSLVRLDGEKRTVLSQGTLRRASLEKNAYAWIRIQKDGSSIRPSISFNGVSFEELSRIRDDSYDKGALGIMANGSYLINTIEVLK